MFLENKSQIVVLTGKPANGKTTVGRLMADQLGFVCIEGDDFITPSGKKRLNNGSWNDVDRKIYLSRMAATTTEAAQDHRKVVVADCLTTQWMRKFLLNQIQEINANLAVGFILLERDLGTEEIKQIASVRSAQGHALDINALLAFRALFEPWDENLTPWAKLKNPGDGNLESLVSLVAIALHQL